MQMSAKETDRLIKQSKILMSFMSGEEKTQYLTRMWDLYFEVYEKGIGENQHLIHEKNILQ